MTISSVYIQILRHITATTAVVGNASNIKVFTFYIDLSLEMQQKKREFRRNLVLEKANMTRHASERRKSTKDVLEVQKHEVTSNIQSIPVTKSEIIHTDNPSLISELVSAPRPVTREDSVVPRAMWVIVKDDDPSLDVVFNARLVHYGVN